MIMLEKMKNITSIKVRIQLFYNYAGQHPRYCKIKNYVFFKKSSLTQTWEEDSKKPPRPTGNYFTHSGNEADESSLQKQTNLNWAYSSFQADRHMQAHPTLEEQQTRDY